MPARVVVFGEVLLRLKAPGRERLFQSPALEVVFGGAESNAAAALAQWGHSAAVVTRLPANAVGEGAVSELRRLGVDTRHVQRGGDRMGIYFVDPGANQRPSRVVYDRAGSSFATLRVGDVPWDLVLDGAGWLHVSGISSALGEATAALTVEGARAARARGIRVSCDYNYRATLWRDGRQAGEVLAELVREVDVGIGGVEDCERVLGRGTGGSSSEEATREVSRAMLDAFPNLSMQVVTVRSGASADHNTWRAALCTREIFHSSRVYDIAHIVDRIGAGDAFAAGLLHALIEEKGEGAALEFATAAGCLKHSIPGDVLRASVQEVEEVLGGAGGGRVRR